MNAIIRNIDRKKIPHFFAMFQDANTYYHYLFLNSKKQSYNAKARTCESFFASLREAFSYFSLFFLSFFLSTLFFSLFLVFVVYFIQLFIFFLFFSFLFFFSFQYQSQLENFRSKNAERYCDHRLVIVKHIQRDKRRR
jgi:hypothetical protein